MQDKLSALVISQREALYNIPNIPNDKVPEGSSAEDNPVVEEWGTIPSLYDGAVSTLGSYQDLRYN